MLKCLVTPAFGKTISGITSKRIESPTEVVLDQKEIIRCMSYGTVEFIRPDGTLVKCTNPSVDVANEIAYRQKMKEAPKNKEVKVEAPVETPAEEEKKDVLSESSLNPLEKERFRRDMTREIPSRHQNNGKHKK